MKIVSWNVNGIRAAHKKGLEGFVRTFKPDLFCVQETKAHPDQVGPEIKSLCGYQSEWASAQKKGYSGVATFWKNETPHNINIGIGVEEFDSEGRVVATDHKDFVLYNIYFPNGQSRAERQEYKMKFNHALSKHLEQVRKSGKEIIVVGDYNIAPTEIDIFDSQKYANTSGFLPIERDWLQSLFASGFVDTFRHFYPTEKERFTWWNQIDRSRISNRGWRIDLICVTSGLLPRLVSANILDDIQGSDHCPIAIELKEV
jgi:exodeoxyribonuclease-3